MSKALKKAFEHSSNLERSIIICASKMASASSQRATQSKSIKNLATCNARTPCGHYECSRSSATVDLITLKDFMRLLWLSLHPWIPFHNISISEPRKASSSKALRNQTTSNKTESRDSSCFGPYSSVLTGIKKRC